MCSEQFLSQGINFKCYDNSLARVSCSDPSDHMMGVASIVLSVIDECRQLNALSEVETQIKILGSTKNFFVKFQDNKEHVEACRESAQSVINQKEEALGRCHYSGNRI